MKIKLKRNALMNALNEAAYYRGRQLLAESEWADDGLQSVEWYTKQWKDNLRLVGAVSTSTYGELIDYVFAEGRKQFEAHAERAKFLRKPLSLEN